MASSPGVASYLDPADIDYRSWNHVGDPLCELMRARKWMGGDVYENARGLEREEALEAVAYS